MAPCISIGNQGFESIREENSFYIDKSDFIRGNGGHQQM